MVDLIPLYCARRRECITYTYPNSSCCATFLPSLRCAVYCLTSEMLPAQSGEQADTDACPPGKTPNLSKQHSSPVNLGGNRPPFPARLHEARPFNTACIEVCRPAPRSGESPRTAQNRNPRVVFVLRPRQGSSLGFSLFTDVVWDELLVQPPRVYQVQAIVVLRSMFMFTFRDNRCPTPLLR